MMKMATKLPLSSGPMAICLLAMANAYVCSNRATYRYVGNTVITNTNQITFIPHCVRMRQ